MLKMAEYVFLFASADKAKLKLVLEGDSLADDSFARLGYDFKDAQALGLPVGKAVVHFRKEGDASKLIEKLKALASFEEAKPEEKKKVLEELEKEADNAVHGFGNVFG
ncbi:hypothetical protein COT58_04000 [Candidatus Micrarchaeota archaeon CG09_land_8_20_14_0_10_60_16]|nr:MAG: hypothetical protein COT58_04000 [Candidatus Micrarchaeota archaeon CG09_land_8_20_14_0_10_60_16]